MGPRLFKHEKQTGPSAFQTSISCREPDPICLSCFLTTRKILTHTHIQTHTHTSIFCREPDPVSCSCFLSSAASSRALRRTTSSSCSCLPQKKKKNTHTHVRGHIRNANHVWGPFSGYSRRTNILVNVYSNKTHLTKDIRVCFFLYRSLRIRAYRLQAALYDTHTRACTCENKYICEYKIT